MSVSPHQPPSARRFRCSDFANSGSVRSIPRLNETATGIGTRAGGHHTETLRVAAARGGPAPSSVGCEPCGTLN